MNNFELWMFPPLVGGLMYVMHLLVMWRLNASDQRDRAAKATAAE